MHHYCQDRGVHPTFGVGTVWRGIGASGGWRCLLALGETQCRRQAWPYGGVRQLGRVRGQGQDRHLRGLIGLAGRGLARLLRLGTRHQYRHQVDEACCRRGGVAGAEPPHKGGPNRPDRPELQGPGVSEPAGVSRWGGGLWGGGWGRLRGRRGRGGFARLCRRRLLFWGSRGAWERRPSGGR